MLPDNRLVSQKTEPIVMNEEAPAPDLFPLTDRENATPVPASWESRSSPEISPETNEMHPVFKKTLEILRREFPPKDISVVLQPGTVTPDRTPTSDRATPLEPPSEVSTPPAPPVRRIDRDQVIPSRMLNEFVYCPRLFYYEHVEGVFLDNADTLRGSAIHQRVDTGKGDLPPAATISDPATGVSLEGGAKRRDAASTGTTPKETEAEVIHSRSVTLGSERLGVLAKLDLIEVRGTPGIGEQGDLFTAREVVPVDYKAGAPREGAETNELWPTDRMQLGLQMLLLRDNGYSCQEGVIYYRATKQRVRLEMSVGLESWILEQIAAARDTMRGPIPPPLVGSPKCKRCSLAPICLPDETTLLARCNESSGETPLPPLGDTTKRGEAPRRLMAARDDTRAVYLNTPGLRVGRKDETLTIKDQEKQIDEVRLMDVHHVALFGNIQLTTQAIQALCDAEIPITYFSGGGWFYGMTRGHGLKNVFLRIEQFRKTQDTSFALQIARQIVSGKIRNHRTLLMRNHSEPPAAVTNRLRGAASDALAAGSLEELLGIEGAAAAAYFEQFGGMLKVGDADDDELEGAESAEFRSDPSTRKMNFDFAGRHRRPPTDPVNALLSLAYSVLAKDCTIAALAVGFDPYVGFYHQPRFGRPALALDLMEEFRPLVAESVVLSAINNRVVAVDDFVRAGQAVNLTPDGRKKFFQTYEQRMSALLTHPVFDYKVSYRRALELQARILAKVLTGEIPEYVPLLTR